MASGNIPPKKPAVWQDIRPINSASQISNKKKKAGKIALFLISLKKPWLRFIFFIKNLYKLGSKFKQLKTKNKIIVGLSVFAIIGVTGGFIIKANFFDNRVTNSGVKVEDLAAKKPQYQTFLPSNKNISELGGWQRVSPNDRVAVFAYIDEIDNVKISVSQQQLPEDFKQDTATQIAELAKSFKADQKITIDDLEVYIGTSVKGPQSVIFAKDQTLILIKSSSKIENASWSSYIKNLK